MTLSGLRSLDKSAIVGLLFVVSGQRDPQGRKLLVGFEPAKAFFASFMAAAVQRKAIEDELQRFTLRVTRRTVPIIFSMMLVQASERRNSAGRPSLLTVRISSNPSRMLFETPGASRSRRWARLRISFSAFAASPSSQAWRNAR